MLRVVWAIALGIHVFGHFGGNRNGRFRAAQFGKQPLVHSVGQGPEGRDPCTPAAQGPGPGPIHAYMQPLPDEDFLRVDVECDVGSTLSIMFHVNNSSMDPALVASIQFLLERPELNARYRAQVRNPPSIRGLRRS